jgi:D-aspartate ligase
MAEIELLGTERLSGLTMPVRAVSNVRTSRYSTALDRRVLPPSMTESVHALQAQTDWPPAIIAGASQTTVLSLRSLQRHGVRTWCIDSNPNGPAFYSVYGPAKQCPNPDLHPHAWLQFMEGLARDIGRAAVLMSSSDQFVTAIARHAQALSEHFIISPGAALQARLADKQSQYELAAAQDMPMPRTKFVRSTAELMAFGRDAAFPCLIKPTHFRIWRQLPPAHPLADIKIAMAETEQQLMEQYRLASEASPEVIAQEVILGADVDKRVYLSCYDARGQRIGNALLRELRCDPVGFGPATITEPILDPEVDDVCDRFLRRIGYVGICEIEMKRDTRDGRPKLIEANPRLSGSGDAAPHAGVELAWLHYLDLIGRPVTPVTPSSRDFRHVVLRNDARVIYEYWSKGMASWADIRHSYTPPLAFYDIDLRDWRYSLETVLLSIRFLARSGWRAIATWISS